MFKEFRISLDLESSKIINAVNGIVQNDSGTNKFIIDLVWNNKPFDITEATLITFTVLKPNKTHYVDSSATGGNVEILDAEKGRISVVLADTNVSQAGMHNATIEIYNGENKMSSARFSYNVVGDLAEGSDPSSDSNFPILQQLVQQVSDKLEDMSGIEEAEALRVEEELLRVEAEEERKENETQRNVFEAFDSSKEYKINNKVAYEGSSYVCIADTIAGTLPTDTNYFLLIAERGNDGTNGIDGIDGVDGISPIVSAISVEGKTTVSITDKNGITTFDVFDGQKGDKGDTGEQGIQGIPGNDGINGINGTDGKDGEDGVSPTISTNKVGKTTTITINDVNGTHTATIMDGADGEGSGDMSTNIYDTHNKAQDIFDYTDNAVSGKQDEITSSNKLDYSLLSGTPTIPTKLKDLTADSTHRVVTDTEKATWNAKSNFSGSYNDLDDKPTIPEAYTLPPATKTTLGGVVVGRGLSISSSTSKLSLDSCGTSNLGGCMVDGTTITSNNGTISGFSGNYNDLTNKPTIPSEYELPTASETVLGGVKVDGETITIEDGVISSQGGSGADLIDKYNKVVGEYNTSESYANYYLEELENVELQDRQRILIEPQNDIYTSIESIGANISSTQQGSTGFYNSNPTTTSAIKHSNGAIYYASGGTASNKYFYLLRIKSEFDKSYTSYTGSKGQSRCQLLELSNGNILLKNSKSSLNISGRYDAEYYIFDEDLNLISSWSDTIVYACGNMDLLNDNEVICCDSGNVKIRDMINNVTRTVSTAPLGVYANVQAFSLGNNKILVIGGTNTVKSVVLDATTGEVLRSLETYSNNSGRDYAGIVAKDESKILISIRKSTVVFDLDGNLIGELAHPNDANAGAIFVEEDRALVVGTVTQSNTTYVRKMVYNLNTMELIRNDYLNNNTSFINYFTSANEITKGIYAISTCQALDTNSSNTTFLDINGNNLYDKTWGSYFGMVLSMTPICGMFLKSNAKTLEWLCTTATLYYKTVPFELGKASTYKLNDIDVFGKFSKGDRLELVYNSLTNGFEIGKNVVTGTYISSTSNPEINVGFTPDLVIVYNLNNLNGTVATNSGSSSLTYQNIPKIITRAYSADGDVGIIEGGFRDVNSTANIKLFYIAIKF